MGTKRPFSAVESQDQAQSSRGTGGRGGFDPKRRRRQYVTGKKHKAKEGSLEHARKRARNIERLFQRNKGLPANVHNELERELTSLKTTLSDRSFQKKRTTMISRYHMVRFFERKKASRLVKQLRRKVEENPDASDIDDLKRQLHIAEVDEAYTMHHPHIEPYISLYGATKNAEAEGEEDGDEDKRTPIAKAALSAERPPLWPVVEKALQEGPEALRQLRERRPTDEAAKSAPLQRPRKEKEALSSVETQQPSRNPKQPQQPRETGRFEAKEKQNAGEKPPLNRRERRRLMREAEAATEDKSDDEDGGFFEAC